MFCGGKFGHRFISFCNLEYLKEQNYLSIIKLSKDRPNYMTTAIYDNLTFITTCLIWPAEWPLPYMTKDHLTNVTTAIYDQRPPN